MHKNYGEAGQKNRPNTGVRPHHLYSAGTVPYIPQHPGNVQGRPASATQGRRINETIILTINTQNYVKKIILLLALAGWMLSGCADINCCDSSVIAVNPTSITLELAKDNKASVDVTSSVVWKVINKPDWVTLPTEGPSGATTLTVTGTENKTGAKRTGTVTFMAANGDQATLEVIQLYASIVMTTEENSVFFRITSSGSIEINWGDGSPSETATLTNDEGFSHAFTSSGTQTITIYGEGITRFKCSHSYITSLDVSGCKELVDLSCNYNDVQVLDLNGLTALKTVECYDSHVVVLDVSGCTSLQYLDCSINYIENFNIEGCKSLLYLNCYDNQLVGINLTDCTALEVLSCAKNILEGLSVSGLTKLTELNCNDNKIEGVDVSDCTLLEILYCAENLISELDVTGLTQLRELSCLYNQMNGSVLNALLSSLSDRTSESISGEVNITHNLSSASSGIIDAARARNWTVYAD